MPLIPYQDVRDLLPQQGNLTDAQLAAAMKLVAGWLREATGTSVLPEPIPATDPLYAPAFELTVLTVTNPESLASRSSGPQARSWPSVNQGSAMSRRDAILAQLRADYVRVGQLPVGSFPDELPLPDPTFIYLSGR